MWAKDAGGDGTKKEGSLSRTLPWLRINVQCVWSSSKQTDVMKQAMDKSKIWRYLLSITKGTERNQYPGCAIHVDPLSCQDFLAVSEERIAGVPSVCITAYSSSPDAWKMGYTIGGISVPGLASAGRHPSSS